MKAFQCSRCNQLQELDDFCVCCIGIDPRPNKRVKGDAELCKEHFEPLTEKEIWHEKFSWEKY